MMKKVRWTAVRRTSAILSSKQNVKGEKEPWKPQMTSTVVVCCDLRERCRDARLWGKNQNEKRSLVSY